MPRNLRTRAAVFFVVLLGSLWYLYPPKKAINLGLDLQGGIHLVLGVETDKHVASQTDRAAEDFKAALERRGIAARRVAREGLASIVVELASPQSWNDALTVANEFQSFDRSDEDQAAGRFRLTMQSRAVARLRDDAVRQGVETIRNRVDQFGVAEPTITRQGEDRILIQLPGVQDPERAKALIGKTALLEFKLVDEKADVEAAVQGRVPEGGEGVAGAGHRAGGANGRALARRRLDPPGHDRHRRLGHRRRAVHGHLLPAVGAHRRRRPRPQPPHPARVHGRVRRHPHPAGHRGHRPDHRHGRGHEHPDLRAHPRGDACGQDAARLHRRRLLARAADDHRHAPHGHGDGGHPLQLRHGPGEGLRCLALRRPRGQPVHRLFLHAAPLRRRLHGPAEGGDDLHMIEIFRNPNYNFIGNRRWAYLLSGLITLIAIVSLATQGLRYDIDFTGGTLVQVRFEKIPTVADIRHALSRIGMGESIIQEFGSTNEFIIRAPLTSSSSEELTKKVEKALAEERVLGKAEIRRVEFVGPQVGKELQLQAVYAVFFGLIGILLYIAIRFDLKGGVAAVIAVFHDVLVCLGALSLFRLEFSLPVLAALLTIIGFSVNDTIVAYDRLRENRGKGLQRGKAFADQLNDAVNQTHTP